jgi:hypothetical protein
MHFRAQLKPLKPSLIGRKRRRGREGCDPLGHAKRSRSHLFYSSFDQINRVLQFIKKKKIEFFV